MHNVSGILTAMIMAVGRPDINGPRYLAFSRQGLDVINIKLIEYVGGQELYSQTDLSLRKLMIAMDEESCAVIIETCGNLHKALDLEKEKHRARYTENLNQPDARPDDSAGGGAGVCSYADYEVRDFSRLDCGGR